MRPYATSPVKVIIATNVHFRSGDQFIGFRELQDQFWSARLPASFSEEGSCFSSAKGDCTTRWVGGCLSRSRSGEMFEDECFRMADGSRLSASPDCEAIFDIRRYSQALMCSRSGEDYRRERE